VKICIPIEQDNGLQSPVCAHFGSAPAFMIVDSDSGDCRALPNYNLHQGGGTCQPLAVLQGEQIDAMVVGGIGMGALNKLNAASVQVYVSTYATVAEILAALKDGTLQLMQPDMACAGQSQGGGHGGGHGGRGRA
jgi:predicted Fe-Mo cluster-binding NifX family protein